MALLTVTSELGKHTQTQTEIHLMVVLINNYEKQPVTQGLDKVDEGTWHMGGSDEQVKTKFS